MGKKAAKKKADPSMYLTTVIAKKKVEVDPVAEEQPVAPKANAKAIAAADSSSGITANGKTTANTNTSDSNPQASAVEDSDVEEWERNVEEAERAAAAAAAAATSQAGNEEDLDYGPEVVGEEEIQQSIEKRFESELQKLQFKANPADNAANVFERKQKTKAPAGVVVLNKVAEAKLQAALDPLREGDSRQLQMNFPKSWRFKGKLTYPRVEAIYAALEALNFTGEQIRWAMEKTHGYDHRAALEMLLVNLPLEELPRQFGGESLGESAETEANAKKNDDGNSPADTDKAGGGGGGEGGEGGGEGGGAASEAGRGEGEGEDEVNAEDGGDYEDGEYDDDNDDDDDEESKPEQPTKPPESKKDRAQDEADFNKRFVAQYCEASDDEDAEAMLLSPEEKLERERRADPTARYVKVMREVDELTKLCKSLKEKKRQGAFKQNISADQQKQRDATAKLSKLQAEMRDLEANKYGKLNQEKIAQERAAAKREGQKKAEADGRAKSSKQQDEKCKEKEKGGDSQKEEAGEDGDDALPDLFGGEAPEPVMPAEAKPPMRKYNIAGWGGRSCRQQLEEHMRKRVWGKNAPRTVAEYKKVPASEKGRFRVAVTVYFPRQAPPAIYDPEEPCETLRDADNLAAAWALFALVGEAERDGVRRNMPPSYRERWQEWKQEAADRLRENLKNIVRRKIDFLERLWRKKPPAATTMQAASDWEAAASANFRCEWGEDTGVLQETSGAAAAKLRQEYRARLEALADDEKYKSIQEVRESLPVASRREEVVRSLTGAGVAVVSGETGSGKTTQVPQFILENALGKNDEDALPNIIVTEPRRISAVSVAKRVSQEIGDPKGGPGSKGSLIGYQIRLEKKVCPSTRLLFCTVGVLLRQLQSGVSALNRVTHIFIDEVHERSADCDLLILLLRQVMRQHRPDLRVVLMSATLSVNQFVRYFGGNIPTISIPGRTFAVETFWLEDFLSLSGYELEDDSEFAKKWWQRGQGYSQKFELSAQGGRTETVWYDDEEDPWGSEDDANYGGRVLKTISKMDHTKVNYELVQETIRFIEESERFQHIPRDEGAILVFLPGLMDITKVAERLARDPVLGNKSSCSVISLHSTLSSDDHAKAFDRPRRGVRKIVLSTNIAETGVTIPDVVFVVDTGKVKCQQYKEATNTASLQEQFVSRAEVVQRRGRAGRVRDGFCFTLMTKHRFSQRLKDTPTPEILRCSLTELMLSVLSSGLQPNCFAEGLDPVPKARIDQAVATLKATGAVEEALRPANAPQWGTQDDVWYVPTPLGLALARLPCDLRLGKMALFGALFGGNEAVWTLAAILSHRSPLANPFSEQRRAEARSCHNLLLPKDAPPSDLLALNTAYVRWHEARKLGQAESFCSRSWINNQAMQTIRELRNDLLESLRSAGFVEEFPKEELTRQDANLAQVTTALCFAGLYPNVARVDPLHGVADKAFAISAGTEQMKLHPGSLCHGQVQSLHATNTRWACYHTKMKTSQVFLRDCTFLQPHALLLFGGDAASMAIHPGEKCIALGSTSERHWSCLHIAPRHAAAIRQLRYAFDAVVRRKALDPTKPLEASSRAVVAAYVSILNSVDTDA